MSLPESSEHPIGLERPKAVSLPYPTAVASGLRSFPKAFMVESPRLPHLALTAASHGGQGVGCADGVPGVVGALPVGIHLPTVLGYSCGRVPGLL